MHAEEELAAVYAYVVPMCSRIVQQIGSLLNLVQY